MKFIVFCPDANTGGPFALLQLAKAINDLNYECEVFFYNIGTVKKKKIKKNFIKNMTIDGSYTIKYKRKPRINIPNLSYKVCKDITRKKKKPLQVIYSNSRFADGGRVRATLFRAAPL